MPVPFIHAEAIDKVENRIDDGASSLGSRCRLLGAHASLVHEQQDSCSACSMCTGEAVHENATAVVEGAIHPREHLLDEGALLGGAPVSVVALPSRLPVCNVAATDERVVKGIASIGQKWVDGQRA